MKQTRYVSTRIFSSAVLMFAGSLVVLPGCQELEQDMISSERFAVEDDPVERGKDLFLFETFGGNGRTCLTCHSVATGTVSPEEAQQRFAADPMDPLFRATDSDARNGTTFNRLLTDATILIDIQLQPHIRLANSSARTVTFARGIPTTMDTPALNPILMYDGRAPNLNVQAVGAVIQHYDAPRTPTAQEQSDLAAFQRAELFSSKELEAFAEGWGPPPELPAGRTDAEKRGREFFVMKDGVVNCASCHSGTLLNRTAPNTPTLPLPPQFAIPPNFPFLTAFVSEFNVKGNPVQTFIFTQPDGSEVTIHSPDPGLALTTGNFRHSGLFKIPILFGVEDTAPYFHDNSARNFQELMDHYDLYFRFVGQPGFTAQEKEDIIAFLALL
jgi:cytochrome c peroxidase